MKNVTRSFKTLALLACGVLFLSLLGGHAMAGKPQQPELWPQGASLSTFGMISGAPYYHPTGLGVGLFIDWPLATGVDHYQLRVEEGNRLVDFEDPVSYSITSAGNAHVVVGEGFPLERVKLNYSITVTAYSGPDEATAYSKSLKATINLFYHP
jgi:hypothetical protein